MSGFLFGTGFLEAEPPVAALAHSGVGPELPVGKSLPTE